MRSKNFTLFHTSRAMFICFIILFTAACGATHVSGTSTQGSSTQGSSSQKAELALNVTKVATVAQVQLRVTITCGPWLVLAPHSPTYSQSELAAMKKFGKQYVPPDGLDDYPIDSQANVTQTGYNPGSPVTLPPTLQYIPGDATCVGRYEITNTGKSLVQVNSLGFQPSQPASSFKYDYRIIDSCSLWSGCPCDGCGAGYPCSYTSDFQMTLSQSLVVGKLEADQVPGLVCPVPINLNPGDTVPIAVTFDEPNTTGGYWYRGIPAINVTSSQGTSTLTYPSLPNNLNFVNLNYQSGGNATCYALKGDTFVAITPNPSAVCI